MRSRTSSRSYVLLALLCYVRAPVEIQELWELEAVVDLHVSFGRRIEMEPHQLQMEYWRKTHKDHALLGRLHQC